MLLKLKFCLILFIIFSSTILVAQISISGQIKDTTNAPIPLVNIFITREEGSSAVVYTYSNDNGYYSLEIELGRNYFLNASALSYKNFRAKLSLDNISHIKSLVKDITLVQEVLSLDEVVVNANLPVLIKKDTIIINVSSFGNGTEEVAEDLLRKLPGIEVTSDGTIKVQGKNVSKVMIEGDDLFENGYKLLTKNLNAGVIDKVEILQHFSENSLLKNIEDSDEIALNIVLKEDVKNTIFGTIDIGYGIENSYENKLNLISVKKKSKFYLFGNMNNIGNDATGDIYQLIYPDFLSSQSYIGDGISAAKIINMDILKPNIKESRFNFNEAELASLSTVFNPNEKLKIKSLLFYTSDENDFARKQIEIVDLDGLNFSNEESNNLRKTGNIASGKLHVILNTDQNSRIEYIGKLNLGEFASVGNLIFNNQSLSQRINDKIVGTDHRITFTSKINSKLAYQVTSRYIYDDKPQNYLFNNFFYEDLFDTTNPIENTQQNSEVKNKFSGLEGTIFSKKDKSSLELRLGYTKQNSNLSTSLKLDDIEIDNSKELSFRNEYKLNMGDLYLLSYYKRYFGDFSLRISADLHQFQAEYGSIQLIKELPINLVPGLGFSWQINKNNKFLVSYKYSLSNTGIEEMNDGYILTNYRSFQKGLGTFQQFRGNSFFASYFLGDWQDSFFLNTSLLYSKDKDYLSSNTEIKQNYLLSSPILIQNREFLSMNLSLDRFIESVSINFKLKGNVSDNFYQNIINDSEIRDISIFSYDYGFEARSVFITGFNFHVGSTWTKSKLTTTQENKNRTNTSFLDIDLKVSKKIMIQIKNERYSFGNLDRNQVYYFSDLNSKYQLKPNKIALKLDVVNIWNSKSFGNYEISDTGSLRSSYRILPRYFLLSMTYRF